MKAFYAVTAVAFLAGCFVKVGDVQLFDIVMAVAILALLIHILTRK